MSDIRTSYGEVVTHLRELGGLLPAALDAQFQSPPGSNAAPSSGPKNPTLETVMDDRRLALSSEISAIDRTLRQVAAQLEPHYTRLSRALARWEGYEGEDVQ